LIQSDDKQAGHVIGDAVNSKYVTITIGDSSAFSINLYNLGNDVVDHFILFLVVRHNCCELRAKSIQTGHNKGQRIHTY
jgi:hypothetical protein